MNQIITSPLDLDFYKITMQAAVYKFYNDVEVEYEFTCRTPGIDFTECFPEIEEQVLALENLRFSDDDIKYLRTIPFLPDAYLRYLSGCRLYPKDEVKMKLNDGEGGCLEIKIKGPWLTTILYETMILSIVNECYFDKTYGNIKEKLLVEGYSRIKNKIEYIKNKEKEIWTFKDNFKFAEFGTRRRFSKYQQHAVIAAFMNENITEMVGTSNVLFAKEFGIKPIGTMAHEWIMAHAGFTRFDFSQKLALQKWLELYGDNLGICLTDTYGTQKFIQDFDVNLARAFNGVRHDSGDPIVWTAEILKMYMKLHISEKDKQIVYSDGLTVEDAVNLFIKYYPMFKMSFGIGTSLSNDMGVPALNIVIKMIMSNGFPCIKTSDVEGKVMCPNGNWKIFVTEFLKNRG